MISFIKLEIVGRRSSETWAERYILGVQSELSACLSCMQWSSQSIRSAYADLFGDTAFAEHNMSVHLSTSQLADPKTCWTTALVDYGSRTVSILEHIEFLDCPASRIEHEHKQAAARIVNNNVDSWAARTPYMALREEFWCTSLYLDH